MKTHSDEFKTKIGELGRELDVKINYTIDEEDIELGNEELNSITPHYKGALLKSVMKQLDIDSNVDIPLGTQINAQFGLKIRTGKNTLDISKLEKGNLYNGNIVFPTAVTDLTLNDDSFTFTTNANSRGVTTDYIQVDALSTYFLSYTKNPSSTLLSFIVATYNENKEWISNISIRYGTGGIYFDTLSNSTYVRINIQAYEQGTCTINNPQFENSPTATPYERFGAYEYLNYGNYIVYSSEKQEDTYSYKIVAYDKMLYAMKNYEGITGTFPMTIRSYIEAICTKLGLTFKNASDTFTNYNQTLENDPYLDSEGLPLEYTYRDILDELAQVTASTICLDENDELEIRYINATKGENLWNPNQWAQINYLSYDETTGIFTASDEDTATYNYIKVQQYDSQDRFINTSQRGSRIYSVGVYRYDGLVDENCAYFRFANNGATKEFSLKINKPTELSAGDRYFFEVNMLDITTGHYKFKDILLSKYDIPYQPYGADLIDEEYLKDVNVNFGEKYGPINSVVLTRSGGADSIALTDEASIEENGLYEIKIEDNQILNGNNRGEYLEEIYNKLHGLEYYINDFTSTGICYYDLCDRYNVKVGDNYYSCVMFNDEIDISQGIEEKVYTEKPEDSETDYTKVDKTDRALKQTYIIVDKQNQTINSVVQDNKALSDKVENQGEQIVSLGTEIRQSLSQIQLNVNSLMGTIENGVPLVKTTSVTINDAGLNVSTTNSKISTTMSNNAFVINGSGTDTFIGYDEIEGTSKAQMDNLRVVNHLTAGCHRTQAVYLDNEWRTCDFYVGRSN